MLGIYEIVNLADGKGTSYVGSSVDIEHRWGQHRSELQGGHHPNRHLQAAWDKYGEDAFVFSALEEVGRDMLLVMEQEYLDDYFDRGHCYNLAITAGPHGPLSEEHKRKIGAAHKGKAVSEETRRKLSEAHKGRPLGEEHRHNISKALQGNQNCLGHKHTEETKRKLSIIVTGFKHNEETKRRIGEAHSRPYPAFVNERTGAYIPAGRNLSELCREYGLAQGNMVSVKNGTKRSCKGWVLA